jgi:hypothetical protein
VSEFQSSELKLLGSAATDALAGALPDFTRVAVDGVGRLTGELAILSGDICEMVAWAKVGAGSTISPVEISRKPRSLRKTTAVQTAGEFENCRDIKLGFLSIIDF